MGTDRSSNPYSGDSKSASRVLLDMARRLAERGNLDGAIESLREAQALAASDSNLSQEIVQMALDLTSRQQVIKLDAPPQIQARSAARFRWAGIALSAVTIPGIAAAVTMVSESNYLRFIVFELAILVMAVVAMWAFSQRNENKASQVTPNPTFAIFQVTPTGIAPTEPIASLPALEATPVPPGASIPQEEPNKNSGGA